MSKRREPRDQQGDILRGVEAAVSRAAGPIAVGLDMAAQPGNWGLAVLALTPDLTRADLCALLPQQKLNADGSRSPTLLFRPSLGIVESILRVVCDARGAARWRLIPLSGGRASNSGS